MQKNINKKSITYWCMHKRGGKKIHCNAIVKFYKDPVTNEVDYSCPDFCGTAHTHVCCQKNNIANMST